MKYQNLRCFGKVTYVVRAAIWRHNLSIQSVSSVAQSCWTIWDPMNHSTPGLPVHHQLLDSLRLTSIESVMPSTHLIFCRPFSSCPQYLPETDTNGMWYRKGGRKFQTKDVRQTPSRVMIPMRHKRNLIKGKTDPTCSYMLSGSTKTMTYSSEPQFRSLQSLSRVWLFATPCTAAHQASLSISNSQSLLKLMSIKSVMPFNYLIPCRPFSSHLQSFPASGSFLMSQFFTSGGQSIGASASASVLLMNI